MKAIYIAGHTGLVGSALVKRWAHREELQLVVATRKELDLTEPLAVERFLGRVQPDLVVIAAGTVGGILANASYPARFIYENLMIQASLIHGALSTGIKRLLNFGSSCMYPRECPQPMSPEHLMSGKVEPTSEPYAVAKWAGLSLCSSTNRQYGTHYMTAIPCTVYGPGDHFDPQEGHVLSSLMAKFHEAKEQKDKEVTLWGSGGPKREFIYSDDLAEACEILLERWEGDRPVNIGPGESVSIRQLAGSVAQVVGFEGQIRWDTSRPDGAPEKRLDSAVIRGLGWIPRTDFKTGLEETYRWFLEHQTQGVGQGRAR